MNEKAFANLILSHGGDLGSEMDGWSSGPRDGFTLGRSQDKVWVLKIYIGDVLEGLDHIPLPYRQVSQHLAEWQLLSELSGKWPEGGDFQHQGRYITEQMAKKS